MNRVMTGISCAWVLSVLGPVAAAGPMEDFQGLLPQELKGLVSKLDAARIQGPSQQPGSVWSASGSLFGMQASLFAYWVRGATEPIIAIPLPGKLSADTLFQVGADLDLGLDQPILFWVPKGVERLSANEMPSEVRARVGVNGIGLPSIVPTVPGFSLFGRVTGGGLVQDLTSLVNLDPSTLSAGITKGKDGRLIASLFRASDWDKPFGLADTTLRGAALLIIKEKDQPSKTVKAWGTARIGSEKDFTVYLMRDSAGLHQSLGFDAQEASLHDFVRVAGVVAKTFKWPALPNVPLPLDKVRLENPKYKAAVDAAVLPDFTAMMFQASQGTSKKDGELHLNAALKAFGWTMAKVAVSADVSGVKGSADLAASSKIGPIEVPSASFYLTLDAKVQAMGLRAQTPLYGALDLKASGSGLQLVVPPQCPLRPVGFTAQVGDLTAGFPILPTYSDCFSQALGRLAEGAEDAYKEAVPFVEELAGSAADSAVQLGADAAKEVDRLQLQRVNGWPGALADYTARLKSPQDAAKAAQAAVMDLTGVVQGWGNKIAGLDGDIARLGREIDRLLDKIWSTVTNAIKGKRRDRQKAISQRDEARTQRAAAEARLKVAQKNQAEATAAVSNIPGPYVVGTIASTQESLLGAQAEAMVQTELARIARELPTQLKDPALRKKVFGTIVPREVIDAMAKDFETEPMDISQLPVDGPTFGKKILETARSRMVEQALTAHLRALQDQVLREKVALLPTVAYGLFVRIIPADAVDAPENAWSNDGISPLQIGVGKANQYTFGGDGTIRQLPFGYVTVAEDRTTLTVRNLIMDMAKKQTGEGVRLFYDPFDGLIRHLPVNGTVPLCIHRNGNRLALGPCPKPNEEVPGTRWRLVDVMRAQTKTNTNTKTSAQALTTLGKGWTTGTPTHLPGGIPLSRVTNLDPLQIK